MVRIFASTRAIKVQMPEKVQALVKRSRKCSILAWKKRTRAYQFLGARDLSQTSERKCKTMK